MKNNKDLISRAALLEDINSCQYDTHNPDMRRAEHIVRAHFIERIEKAPEACSLSAEELMEIMSEYGMAIRVIPKKITHIYEMIHEHRFPGGHSEYLERFGRNMWVVEEYPKNAGKVCIEEFCGTSSTVSFHSRLYDSIEEAVSSVVGKITE